MSKIRNQRYDGRKNPSFEKIKMIEKNFNNWNEEKMNLEQIQKLPHFHERYFWWCSMWINIWSEQDWKWKGFLRPVVILKKVNKSCFYWLPLSSTNKESYYNFHFSFKWKHSNAILSQVRLFSAKRLIRIEWRVWGKTFQNLKNKIKELFS